MNSLHLFTIPKWFPNNIPTELWVIIFYWKWKLEMKDIHRFLIDKISYMRIGETWLIPVATSKYPRGNCWQSFGEYKKRKLHTQRMEISLYGKTNEIIDPNGYDTVYVTEKCGIELLNWKSYWRVNNHAQQKYRTPDEGTPGLGLLVFKCKENLCRHLQENLGIKCPKNLKRISYKNMLSLLKTV
jgi:hypothetical protein